MLMTLLVVLAVSSALMLGAAWGLFGRMSDRVEGLMVAFAGGALLLSAVSELIEPSVEKGNLWEAVAGVIAGAVVFAGADYLIDEKWGPESGGGLLVAVTLDGIPENLALGVALIGAGPPEVAALAGSIFLSNLPEAAGGARQMRENGSRRRNAFGLWAATAGLLSLAAIAGYALLDTVADDYLAVIRCFAAGAVVASLATEVFPQAYRDDKDWTGIATAAGLVLALLLGTLGGG